MCNVYQVIQIQDVHVNRHEPLRADGTMSAPDENELQLLGSSSHFILAERGSNAVQC